MSFAARLTRAAALYFAIVFAVGLVLGPARVLWLEPWLGKTIAVLCEAPLLIAAMVFAAKWAPTWTRFDGDWRAYLVMGLAALVLQQVADLAVGFGLRGMTLTDQFAYFGTPPGYIYAACLAVFALAPFVQHLRAPRSSASAITHSP